MLKVTISTFILGLSVIFAVCFGIWGWTEQKDALNITILDALYRSIATLPVSDELLSENSWNNDWRIQLARWFGLLAFILGIIKLIVAILAEQFKILKAKLRSNHLMIIGNAPIANFIADTAFKEKMTINWLAADQSQATRKNPLLFIKEGAWSLSEAEKFSLKRASRVAIVDNDDATAIAIAREIRTRYPNEKLLTVTTFLQSPWLAMRIDDVEGVTDIRLHSLAQTAIRQVHRKHPPFLIAQKHEHEQIHAVIVGFGLYGEAVLIDLLLSSLTIYLKKPMVTIIDPRGNHIRRSIALRYPELEESVTLNFIAKTLEGDHNGFDQNDIVQVSALPQVTSSYICLPDASSSLSAAIAFQVLLKRHDWGNGPVFTRLANGDAIPDTEAGVDHLKNVQLIGFGDLKSLVSDTGVLNDNVDDLARLMHKRYLEFSDNSASNISWEELSEDKRDSNRRLVIHFAAKISSMGVDIEPWIKDLDLNPSNPLLPKIDHVVKNNELIEKLSLLEHDRWMADRRVNGWKYSKIRDDQKRLHPDLISYEELTERTKEYDRKMILMLFSILDQ